jgi:hypothetical protein
MVGVPAEIRICHFLSKSHRRYRLNNRTVFDTIHLINLYSGRIRLYLGTGATFPDRRCLCLPSVFENNVAWTFYSPYHTLTNKALRFSSPSPCRPGSVVGITTGYELDGPRIESRWGSEIFRTCPNRPCGPNSLLYSGYRVFPDGKERPLCEADPLPASTAVGHERVELYLYPTCGPYGLYRASVHVQGCTLPITPISLYVLCNMYS